MSNAPNTAGCCDMHNQHCEPPADLCCRDCTEAAHDTFPIRHADGTTCVLDRLVHPQPDDQDQLRARLKRLRARVADLRVAVGR